MVAQTPGRQRKLSHGRSKRTSAGPCLSSLRERLKPAIPEPEDTDHDGPANMSSGDDCLFPKNSIMVIWIVTVIVRLCVVARQDSGWILHPDEVFQSVEVAHSLVYGYGFRPYEYLPPAEPNASLNAERQEAATGMYSLRSFIYPKIFALFLWTMEACGFTGNPFRMCRIFHAFVAAHLPVSAYMYVKALLDNASEETIVLRDAPVLCAVLVSFSEPLSFLGTHPLVNSLLAPVTLLCLALFASRLLGAMCDQRDQNNTPQGESLDTDKNVASSDSPAAGSNVNGSSNDVSSGRVADTIVQSSAPPKQLEQNGTSKKGSTHAKYCNKIQLKIFFSTTLFLTLYHYFRIYCIQLLLVKLFFGMLFSTVSHYVRFYCNILLQLKLLVGALLSTVDHYARLYCNKVLQVRTIFNRTHLWTFLQYAKYYCNKHHLILILGASLYSIIHLVSIFGSVFQQPRETCNKFMALVSVIKLPMSQLNYPVSGIVFYVVGLVFGLLAYVRLDLGLFIFAMSLTVVILNVHLGGNMYVMLDIVLRTTIGVFIGILLCGWEDRRSYGVWFISPYQWFMFNVKNDMSSVLFGSHDISYYAEHIFLKDTSSTLLFVAVASALLLRYEVRCNEAKACLRSARILASFMAVLLFAYSIQRHKELRFVHNLIVVYYMIVSLCVVSALTFVGNSPMKKTLTYMMLTLYVCKWYSRFSVPSQRWNHKWAYLDKWDTHHLNDCLEFVGRQEDSTGVFIDQTIHTTGAYSVLHKNIPIFTLIHYEFHEYAKSVNFQSGEKAWIDGRGVSYVKLNRISNFVAVENSPLLLKYILQDRLYNYMVVKDNRTVIKVGFQEVYTSGTVRVLRRTQDGHVEKQLQKIASSIPMGRNVTILAYEASWLYTYGLHEKAIQRLKVAGKLVKPDIRTFQLMAICYSAMNQKNKAESILSQCLEEYGPDCAETQPRIILHEDYPDMDMYIWK